jgi:hypothetical protein
VRLGLGWRSSARTRVEVLWIRDWNRSAEDAPAAEDVQAFDLRVRLLL